MTPSMLAHSAGLGCGVRKPYVVKQQPGSSCMLVLEWTDTIPQDLHL